jgi:pSer/pThr/pTyr-binding forkhead associated (FHA) protein
MMLGELMPVGGGDPIPLLKPHLVIGRRESCDIVLRFPNVSGSHCELVMEGGYWTIRDLGSSNGTKVNGTRVSEQRLDPGDVLTVAKHQFEIVFEPAKLGAKALPESVEAINDLFSRPLLESAGLVARRGAEPPTRRSRPR